jgi:hypothetical protein
MAYLLSRCASRESVPKGVSPRGKVIIKMDKRTAFSRGFSSFRHPQEECPGVFKIRGGGGPRIQALDDLGAERI